MMFFIITAARIIGAIFTALGNVIGITLWIKLHRKNKRAKISTATLLTLRQYLAEHRNERVVVHLEVAQSKVIGGVTAYNVRIPHFIADWKYPTVHCVYIKQEILDGFYTYIEYHDGLMFTLLNAEGNESAFAFVIRLNDKQRRKEKEDRGDRKIIIPRFPQPQTVLIDPQGRRIETEILPFDEERHEGSRRRRLFKRN
ncbi:MAG: hypothetical protein RLY57_185, partial [Candidatus Parcubacteria bacterium]